MTRRRCRECGASVRPDDAVFMGASPAISGPGVARYACITCVRTLGLVPPAAPAFVGHRDTPPSLTGGAS